MSETTFQPFSSWVFNSTSNKWEAPKPFPSNGKVYYWDESTTSWAELTIGEE
jgi:hypothetical protein